MLLLPWVAADLIRMLVKSRNRRNLPLGATLVLHASASLVFHAAVLGLLNIDPIGVLHAGLALLVMIECVISGRVIPAFTMSALPGRKLQTPLWLERAALSATALSPAAWLEEAAYPLILCAALVLPLLVPDRTTEAVPLAAIAWAVAFALYLGRFAPWLLTSRLDGKDG